MFDDDYDPNNLFPHDGENGRNCTGYGCDCDEKNYGSYGRGSRGSGSGGGWLIAFIVALVVGYGINELLGAMIMIGLIFYVMVQ